MLSLFIALIMALAVTPPDPLLGDRPGASPGAVRHPVGTRPCQNRGMDEYFIGAGALLTAGPEATLTAGDAPRTNRQPLGGSDRAAVIDFEAARSSELSRLLIVAAGWAAAQFRVGGCRCLTRQRECSLADVIAMLAERDRGCRGGFLRPLGPGRYHRRRLEERGIRLRAHPLEAIGQAALVSGQRLERWRAPFAQPSDSGASKGEKARCSVEMLHMPNARVAVIDDDRMVREMLELGLSREGYEVRTAMDGLAALELVKVFDPELIVLDIMMPKIDGVTLLAAAARNHASADPDAYAKGRHRRQGAVAELRAPTTTSSSRSSSKSSSRAYKRSCADRS